MEWSNMVASKAKVCDMAVITHAVPARRLRRILPDKLLLETFIDADSGEEKGFVSVTSSRVRRFRSAAVGIPRINFCQVTYRTYVTHKGLPCVYLFNLDLNTWPAYALQRMSSSGAQKSEIKIMVNTNLSGGYDIYECETLSETGKLDFYLQANKKPRKLAPFPSGSDKIKFFMDRGNYLFKSSLGLMADQLAHVDYIPVKEADVVEFQCDHWVRLGVLKDEERLSNLHNAFVAPVSHFTYYLLAPTVLMPRAA